MLTIVILMVSASDGISKRA